MSLPRRIVGLSILLLACQPKSTASPDVAVLAEPHAQPEPDEAAAPEVVEQTIVAPEALEAALAYSAETGGHATHVVVDGTTLALEFHNGWDKHEHHPLASGTKSFWGPLVAIAIDDGLIESFDELASDTLTEWKDDPRRSKITIRQLLAFTSGLKADLGVTMEKVPEVDMFALALGAEAEHEPGAKWAYSDSGHTAVGLLLERKLAEQGSSLDRYLQERLLAPLEIESPQWRLDAAGHKLMPSGARLSPVQWAAFGELIRRKGEIWNGTRVVSEANLAQCFEPSSAPPAGQFYGLGWWLASYTSYGYDIPSDMVIAGGSGGQFLFVIPSLGLTVARFGEGDDFVDGEFLCRLLHGTDKENCPKRPS